MRRPGPRYSIDETVGAAVLVMTMLYFAAHLLFALAR